MIRIAIVPFIVPPFLIAVAALLPSNTSSKPPPETQCSAIEMTLDGPMVEHPGRISLDMDGRWFIPDWRVVRNMTLLPMDIRLYGDMPCVSRWLFAHRATIKVTEHPNFSCANYAKVHELIYNNAAVEVCGVCKDGEKCL